MLKIVRKRKQLISNDSKKRKKNASQYSHNQPRTYCVNWSSDLRFTGWRYELHIEKKKTIVPILLFERGIFYSDEKNMI